MEVVGKTATYSAIFSFIGSLPKTRLLLGMRYGKLFVSRAVKNDPITGRAYLCQCDCGHNVYLTPFEIKVREELGEGCASEQCFITSTMGKRWMNWRYSLRMQWGHWVYTRPRDVQYEWGGFTTIERGLKDEEKAFHKFMLDVYAQDLFEQGKIWARKIDKKMPFMEGNVRLTNRYPQAVFSSPWRYMSDGSEYRDYGYIADLCGVGKETVMQVRSKHVFSHDAFLELMDPTKKRGR